MKGGKFSRAVFYHTHQVFCAVGARPPRLATTAATTTAATGITGVIRLCNATRTYFKGKRVFQGFAGK